MPEELQPSVWWILIGVNDIRMGCSLDTVVAGNIRIVQEIQQQQGHDITTTPVVINSILPTGADDLLSPKSRFAFIQGINRRLRCYAEINEGVQFANATDTMTETVDDGVFLKEGYFASDHIHPTSEGSKHWEEFIVQGVLGLST